MDGTTGVKRFVPQCEINWWNKNGAMLGGLTAQEIRGGVWRGMSAEQLPIKVILLPLAELAQTGVGVLIKRAARCRGRERERKREAKHVILLDASP